MSLRSCDQSVDFGAPRNSHIKLLWKYIVKEITLGVEKLNFNKIVLKMREGKKKELSREMKSIGWAGDLLQICATCCRKYTGVEMIDIAYRRVRLM